ncbi:tRNA pseudouridine(38-40) synthase TruA [Spiroplasma endosymbiont of Amphibalanus improvisus]|uniref:tRNA pseudouridine(38-40) synthase TruA n=1 Tax=Spiroplasma endosymbiont of Amphibalanus improvisus TaxID=3066327 RepID=UPI00313D113B
MKEPINNFLLTLQYNGFNYKGWIKQNNQKTVQGCLEKAIEKISKTQCWTMGASKTDAGVHAKDQKVLLKLNYSPHLKTFLQGINSILPKDIFISSIKPIEDDFNIRKTSQKWYRYTINCYENKNPFTNLFEMNYGKKINCKKISKIMKTFVGEHYFLFFSNVSLKENINLVRKINKIKISKNKNKIFIDIFGKSFIRHQIRIMIAIALKVYEGKMSLEDISYNLIKKNVGNKKANYCADPNGLCLMKIWF